MKNRNYMALAGAMGLALTCGTLCAQPVPEPQNGPAGRGPEGPPRELLEKYDADGDGVLNAEERAAIRKDRQEGKLQPPFGRGPGAPGAMRGGGDQQRAERPETGDGQDQANPGGPGRMGPWMRHPGNVGEPGGMGFNPGIPGPGMSGTPGGGGPVNPPSAKAILQRFDLDKDGMLNERELTRFLRTLPPGRPLGQPEMQGMPPMGRFPGGAQEMDRPMRPQGQPRRGGPPMDGAPGNGPDFDGPEGGPVRPPIGPEE